jgi:hypothetical protein
MQYSFETIVLCGSHRAFLAAAETGVDEPANAGCYAMRENGITQKK